jgi:hypothetical protein
MVIQVCIQANSVLNFLRCRCNGHIVCVGRRGLYAPGTTHSDTYWDRVWEGCLESDRLTSWAPTKYYSSPFEDDTINYAALEAAEKDVERTRQQALLAVS